MARKHVWRTKLIEKGIMVFQGFFLILIKGFLIKGVEDVEELFFWDTGRN